MNWKLEDNVTSLEDSKRLKEAGIDLGKADGYWAYDLDEDQWFFSESTVISLNFINVINDIPVYRLDRLLVELPEWWQKIGYIESGGELKRILYPHIDKTVDAWSIRNQCRELMFSRGQEAIKAAVDLLCLLKKEGIE